MILSHTAIQTHNIVVVEVWLVDETAQTSHPERVESLNVDICHNGNTILASRTDRFFGNCDGSIQVSFANLRYQTGLSVRLNMSDTDGNPYQAHSDVVVETLEDPLPTNPAHQY